jgi:hypothetical protein
LADERRLYRKRARGTGFSTNEGPHAGERILDRGEDKHVVN